MKKAHKRDWRSMAVKVWEKLVQVIRLAEEHHLFDILARIVYIVYLLVRWWAERR